VLCLKEAQPAPAWPHLPLHPSERPRPTHFVHMTRPRLRRALSLVPQPITHTRSGRLGPLLLATQYENSTPTLMSGVRDACSAARGRGWFSRSRLHPSQGDGHGARHLARVSVALGRPLQQSRNSELELRRERVSQAKTDRRAAHRLTSVFAYLTLACGRGCVVSGGPQRGAEDAHDAQMQHRRR
jgi:hypothetical protein